MRTFFLLLLASCGSNAVTPSKPSCADLSPGDLVITEVMIDPDGADTGNEWFEVLNQTARRQSMVGLTVASKDPSGAERSTALKSGELPPHGAIALGDTKEATLPWYLASSYGGALGAFSQSGGTLSLRCGELVLDAVDWHSGAKPGRSRMLDPLEQVWCDAPLDTTYSGANHGSPGAPNPSCFSPATCLSDDGAPRAVVTPASSALRITEVMASPKAASDSVGEWFEVQASLDTDLNGVLIVTSTGASMLESPGCLHLAAGQFGVIARSADPFVNGGLPAPIARFNGTFSSNNERIGLFIGDAGLDALAFSKSTPGVSWQRSDDSNELCLSTHAWPDGGGDFGSPGARNASCTPADAGEFETCIDEKTRFVRRVVTPPVGAIAITEVLADPTAVTDEAGEWFEVLASTGFDLNALTVSNEGGAMTSYAVQACRWVDAGTTVLFARNANAALNGGLPPVDATFSFSLGNSGARMIKLLHGELELARWVYTSATPGASTQRDPASGELCVTPPAVRYGTAASADRGTPGRPNVTCP